MAKRKNRAISKSVSERLVKKIDDMIGEGHSFCEKIHKDHAYSVTYASKDQWEPGDVQAQKRRKRPHHSLNDVFKIVNAVANREIVERFTPKVFGNQPEDYGVADVLDAACQWQRDKAHSEHYESMAFRSAIIGGYGCAHKFWDPLANDGGGQIKDEDVPIYEMLWPSKARDINLLDRRWHVRGKWVDADEAEALYGSSSSRLRKKFRKLGMLDAEEMADTSDLGNSDRKMSTMSGFGWTFANTGAWVNKAKQEVFVAEAEWREVEYAFRAAVPIRFYDWYEFMMARIPIPYLTQDPETGEEVEAELTREQYDQMDPEEQQQLEESIVGETEIKIFETRKDLNAFLDLWAELFGEEFDLYYRTGREVIKYAIRIDDEIAEYGTRPWGWTYHFITAFPRETQDGCVYHGIVDILKGPQDYKNALISNLLAQYMASSKGGIVIGKSVGDKNKIADQWASPDGLIVVDDQVVAQWEQKVKQLPQPQFPETGQQLLSIFSDGVIAALGMSPLTLGTQGDLRRLSGNVADTSKVSENTILALPFDSLKLFRKEFGVCNIRFITKMYDLEEIARIIGPDKEVDLERLTAENWGDIEMYDVKVDETTVSPNEMMRLAEALMQTGQLESWRGAGEISMEDVLKILGPLIPESVKRSILSNRSLMDQIQQAQSQTQQLQLMVQSIYQYLQGLGPEGEQILTGFLNKWQQQQASQEIFSQSGAQPQGGAPLQ